MYGGLYLEVKLSLTVDIVYIQFNSTRLAC